MAKAYGLVLDPWQENVLEAAMGERSDGQWAAPRVGVAVPRQNGKGALIEARELAGLLVFGEQSIVHSAHQQATARVGFDRIKSYFDNYDDLRRKVKAIGTAVAREYIELKSGQMLRFPARSKAAIRGFSIDLLLLDEAQEFSDAALQAVMPTLSARPNPQMWLLGTPPTRENNGEVFTRWRRDGHEGKDRRLCWVEWSPREGVDLDDRKAWAESNPALGERISYEAVSDERAALDDEGFARERLGAWSADVSNRVIPSESWDAVGDRQGVAVDRFALGIECGQDLSLASVSIAGLRPDGGWQTALLEQHGGADWLPAMVEGYLKVNPQIRAVSADAGGPIRPLLEERGPGQWFLKGTKVRVMCPKSSELASACSTFLAGVVTGDVWHTDQPQVNAAVAVAGKRAFQNDSGLWVWSRKAAVSDITPVQAATLALWAAQQGRPSRPQRSTNSERRAVVL